MPGDDIAVCPCCGSTVNPSDMPDEIDVGEVMTRFPVPRSAAILFLSLWHGQGRTMTFDTLMDMQDRMTRRESSSMESIRTSKKHLWKVMRNYPVRIEATYGLGYCLKLLDKDWHWRNEPIYSKGV